MRKVKFFKHFSTTILICMIGFSSFSQPTAILDYFTAFEYKGSVYLNWMITSGSTCDGIKIYRSTDSLSFKEIGNIGGVCGSTSAPQPYSFTDENPDKNSINYYRLELGFNDFSEIISLEVIILESNKIQIRPNPVVNKAKIYFENSIGEKFNLLLYDSNGRLCKKLSTNEDFFIFDSTDFQSGNYFFIISNSNGDIINISILIVQH